MARQKRYPENDSIMLDTEMKAEVEELARKHRVSKSNVYRALLRLGLVAYHQRGEPILPD